MVDREQETFQFNSSGSTGSPKTIEFTRAQLEASARMSERALQLRAGFTSLVCLDTQFIAGAMMLVRSLVTGMNIVIVKPSSNPLHHLSEAIDFAAFVPYQADAILTEDASVLNSLKVIIIGGAALQEKDVQLLQGVRAAAYATYGMTETISHVALRKLNGTDRQEYFSLLPGISAQQDERGCILIHAPLLGVRDIQTNDVVTFVDENKFYLRGRHDRVINSGGVKIQPELVEKTVAVVLAKLKMSNRFFVAGLPDQRLGEQVALFIEGSLRPHEEARIASELQSQLDKYQNPKVIQLVQHFEETSSQKIDRLRTLEKWTTEKNKLPAFPKGKAG